MIPFRQLILPGDVGSDVLAVKQTLRRLGIAGNADMTMNTTAGRAFVGTLRNAQAQGGITVDGKYGRDTHGVIAPHFTPEDAALYAQAAIRRPVPPPPSGDAASNARQLLQLQAQGKYHADNPGDLTDIQATAQGRAVHSQSGQMVHIDPRVMEVLVHLIGSGHTIGTFAICSDHHDDGPHGHAGGFAVDISTIDGHAVASSSARAAVLQVDKELHNSGGLVPRQLITGGVGNVIDQTIESFTIPNPAFYGAQTMQEHTNHIHIGY
jgi:peptidoglycan hydrolase-like protein with peptidoglycan-binding domain